MPPPLKWNIFIYSTQPHPYLLQPFPPIPFLTLIWVDFLGVPFEFKVGGGGKIIPPV